MSIERGHILGGNVPSADPPEALRVQSVFGLDPSDLAGPDLEWYDAYVTITQQFSRSNPESGDHEMISPSRVEAIPAITDRHLKLMLPARGLLSTDEVVESWRGNMPENDGLRHPDHLFDMTQRNFGTDEPIGHIEYGIMRAELERRELMDLYRGAVRHAAAHFRNERPLDDDTSEELLDAFVDEITRP